MALLAAITAFFSDVSPPLNYLPDQDRSGVTTGAVAASFSVASSLSVMKGAVASNAVRTGMEAAAEVVEAAAEAVEATVDAV